MDDRRVLAIPSWTLQLAVTALAIAIGLPIASPVAADELDPAGVERMDRYRRLAEATALQQAGDETLAFQAYLLLAGAEQLASTLGSQQPACFLAEIEESPAAAEPFRVSAVRGDLLLAAGDRASALDSYREAATQLSRLGYEGYLVELEPPGRRTRSHGLLEPFFFGPGSHRDNWLVRRFIGLAAWDDAERELARIAALHRARAGDGQYGGLGLQFTLDLAFFLNRRGRPDAADAALGELLQVLARVDFDRNPDLAGLRDGGRSHVAGISRKEFVRLAFGLFKEGGAENRLVGALTELVDTGTNRARRTLARVRLHQGRSADALDLELTYVARAELDPISTAYRRGRAFEAVARAAEAAPLYEDVLRSLEVPRDRPDIDEEDLQAAFSRSSALPSVAAADAEELLGVQHDLLQRLIHLYGALGQTEAALQARMRRLALAPTDQQGWATELASAALAHRALGKEPAFHAWVAATAPGIDDLARRRRLYESVGDVVSVAATDALILARRTAELERKIADRPDDRASRLELLRLRGDVDTDEALELQLWVGVFGSPLERYRSPYEVAYTLLRRYQHRDDPAAFWSLAMRLIKTEEPFGHWPGRRRDPFIHENDSHEDLHACLALIIAVAADTDLDRLEAGLRQRGESARSALALLDRRRNGLDRAARRGSVPWSNLPPETVALAADTSILSLARDARYLFAGLPWGVGVYAQATAAPVVRIALGRPATALAVTDDHLWVGTDVDLVRIEIGSWRLARLDLTRHLPARTDDRRPADRFAVTALAVDGPLLWIATAHSLQRLDRHRNRLRVYSDDETSLLHTTGQFLVERDHVWTDRLHYDRKRDSWTRLTHADRDAGVIGLLDPNVWGWVRFEEPLGYRPAFIDRRTLEFTPILFADPSTQANLGVSISNYGRHNGRPVFGTGGPEYYLDASALVPLPRNAQAEVRAIDSDLPIDLLRSYGIRRPSTGSLTGRFSGPWSAAAVAPWHEHISEWLLLDLPGGRRVLGARRFDGYDVTSPGVPRQPTPTTSGGLFMLSANDATRISRSDGEGDLPGGVVHAVVFDHHGRAWACTNAGIAVIDSDGRVVSWITSDDGLVGNNVVAGVALDGKLYFASAHGDQAGGITVFDPETAVMTTLLRADRLAAEKVTGLNVRDGQLEIIYGVERLRSGGGDYRLHPPGRYDPATGSVTPGGEPRVGRDVGQIQNDPRQRTEQPAILPVLGGHLIASYSHEGKTYLAGSHGLVILEGDDAPGSAMTALEPTLDLDPAAPLRAEAASAEVRIESVAELQRFLRHPNPYLRQRALGRIGAFPPDQRAAYVPVLGGALRDPHAGSRQKAAELLATSDSKSATRFLREALNDPDPKLWSQAAIGLARLGEPVASRYLEEILTRPLWDHEDEVRLEALEAFAPRADAGSIGVFVRHPRIDSRVTVPLGAAIRRRPDAAPALLAAQDTSGQDISPVEFARVVFQEAGVPLLPTLHAALASPDRVIRSNAARGCGAIGDPSSIPFLIDALDLESGLARASIVWALGELRARQALPRLTELFRDARNDEARRQGAGFRSGQAGAAISGAYTELANLNAIGSDWDELQEMRRERPVDPRRDEQLLSTQDVLRAISAVGADASQELYRLLTADADDDLRREAAVRLAEGEIATNRGVLLSLLSDPDDHTRIEAAVSLLILGDRTGEPFLLDGITTTGEWHAARVLGAFARVPDKRMLSFAAAGLRYWAVADVRHYDMRARASALLAEMRRSR